MGLEARNISCLKAYFDPENSEFRELKIEPRSTGKQISYDFDVIMPITKGKKTKALNKLF